MTHVAAGQRRTAEIDASGVADAVYFLMFQGWTQELQANRWHWAKRWAQLLPVVLVQPTQVRAPRKPQSETDPRLPNTRVLHVKSPLRGPSAASAETALGQIASDLEARGFERPLLWCYNARLAGPYAGVPAVARVYHATENHFAMEGLEDTFLEDVRRAVRLSDLTIAVSSGVGKGIAAEVPAAKVAVVTNGCDFAMYAGAAPDGELAATAARWSRVAVYAGNVNSRLDYDLLVRAARRHADDLFAFFGPVVGLRNEDAPSWQALLALPNVKHFGPVEPDRLPQLYAAADVGLLPYKRTPLLVENAFPLKALEMAATGLPVVSSRLDPLTGLARGIVVAAGDDEFLAALELSRDTLPAGEREELVELARRNDYDRKFRTALELVAGVAHEPQPPVQPGWREHAIQRWQEHARPRVATRALGQLDRVRFALLRLLVRLFPARARNRVPGSFRRAVERFLHPS